MIFPLSLPLYPNKKVQGIPPKKFGVQDIGEQPGGTLEVQQDFIDYSDIDTPLPERLVTKPVNVYHYK